ncbi:hypothetical protein [Cerasicoccus maritimus]|uniref:hypothetical protein n=1 Tax=Cerasicoccus maritimus TaxID=490089 RepID=UPI002852D47F|nr:hypothetical protein [Cerasicoccus maritimus]
MAFLTIIPVAALGALTATSFNETFLVGEEIPDNDPAGLSDTQFIDASDIVSIETIQIDLELSGGWLGDIYGYVQHDSGFSVLLNRVGRNEGSLLGSSASALDVTFTVDGPDIHVADAPYTGIYGVDGRETDPSLVLDTDSQTAMLSSFVGLPASGNWTLFLADIGPGEITTVESWSLSITGVPEPMTTVSLLGIAAGVLVLVRSVGRRKKF